MGLREELEMEYHLCNAFFRPGKSDFYEGIRALLIDKDKNPRWMHQSVSEVEKTDVEALGQYL